MSLNVDTRFVVCDEETQSQQIFPGLAGWLAMGSFRLRLHPPDVGRIALSILVLEIVSCLHFKDRKGQLVPSLSATRSKTLINTHPSRAPIR